MSRPHIDAALDQLNPGDRDAVVLTYFQSHSTAQAAAVLGTSEGSLRQRVYRGLTKLRAVLRAARRGRDRGRAGRGILTHAVEAAPPALHAATLTAVAAGPGEGSRLPKEL